MARQLDPKAIKERIKTNTAVMRLSESKVSQDMTGMLKGDIPEPFNTRAFLADFIKAAKAVINDKAKL